MPIREFKRRRTLRSFSAAAILGIAAIALVPEAAWAQPKKNSKEPTPEEAKGYTLPYFFTAIGVLAVTVPLCWPALRKWDVPTGKDDE